MQLSRKRGRREDGPTGRDKGVRGSVAPVPWEENAHAHDESREANHHESTCWMFDPPKRFERRETFDSPILPYGTKDSVGLPHRASGESESETHEVWVHAVRLGGRHRLDASRIFHTGGSQGSTVIRRALARKKSVAPPDAGRGWAEGETVRVYEIANKFSRAWPAGSSLAGSRYDERRSRVLTRPAFTGRAK
jgi:hypothetical protein